MTIWRAWSGAFVASVAMIATTACSTGGGDGPAQRDAGAGAPRTAEGGPVAPESAGVAAPAVDSTPEPAEDPAQVVGAVAVPKAVERGKTATLTFRTRPGSSCQVEVRTAGTDGQGGARLPAAVANDAGLVSWVWNVGSGVDPGTATAFVVCSGGQRGQADVRIA